MNGRLISIALLILCPASSIADKTWTYVASLADEFNARPSYRAIGLTDALPDDFLEVASYRGGTRHYAQLRYGGEDSGRVLVVLDEIGGGEFDLYVDADRNRTIESHDLVAGGGRVRTVPLDVEVIRSFIPMHTPRSVALRRDLSGRTLGVATAGFVEGGVEIDGRALSARRVDGDGNGLFSDLADRLWIDLDADGRWDPLAEQYPMAPTLRLGDQRFAVRADPLGMRLTLAPLAGEGRVRLAVAAVDDPVSIVKLDVMLVGDDGSAFTVSGADEAVVLPIGRYAVGAVSVSIRRGALAAPWTFVFSRSGAPLEPWYDVALDAEVSIDPIGAIRFAVDGPQGNKPRRPGDQITITPRLYTQDGLLINSCSHGDASLTLVDAERRPIAHARSGFA